MLLNKKKIKLKCYGVFINFKKYKAKVLRLLEEYGSMAILII